MFKSLIRILPLLSGNVMINCTLSDYENTDNKTYQCYVRGASLDPLSSNIYRKQIKCNLLGSTYDYDLKNFYKYYKDIFYTSSFYWDKSDMMPLNKEQPIINRNVDMEFGCARRSVKNTDHVFEFFAPIYITSINDLPKSFVIDCTFHTPMKDVSKKIVVNIGSNYNSKKNYLYHYLQKYLQKINDNFIINLSASSKQSTINGIDLINGGIANGHDYSIKSLFENQQTINNFDFSICNQYKNCDMAMKEVLPLSFSLDLTKIIDSVSVIGIKNCDVTISGHYIDNNGNDADLYDWDDDYDTYSVPVLKMNEENGTMEYVSGDVENIMDDGYPSLHECRMDIYKNSNKLTKMYTRWKTMLSSDKYPYVINLAFAFNRNQNSQIQYGQYPAQSYTLKGLCDIYDEGKNSLYYNFRFPLGSYKELYVMSKKNTSSPVKSIPYIYKNQFNSFAFNWFNIAKDENTIFDDDSLWGDIKGTEVYYNGVLHNMNAIYNTMNSGYEPIDKFGIFLIPQITVVEGDLDESIKVAEYTINIKIKSSTSKNCKVNTGVISDYLLSSGIRRASDSLFTSINPLENDMNGELTNKEMFKKIDSDNVSTSYLMYDNKRYSYTYINTTDDLYLDIKDTGVPLEKINGWRDLNDVISASQYVYENKFEDFKTSLLSYTESNWKTDKVDTEKIVDIALATIYQEPTYLLLNKTKEIQQNAVNSISYNSYELLPVHTISLLCDDTIKYNNNYVLKFGGSLAYQCNAYTLMLKFKMQGETSYNEIVCTYDGLPITFNAGYTYVDVNGFDGELSLGNIAQKYGKITNGEPLSDVTEKVQYTYFYKVEPITNYVDDLIKQIYVSSSTNITPKHTEYFIEGTPLYSAYDCIELGESNPHNAYEYSIWRKSAFVRTNMFDRMKENAVTDLNDLLQTAIYNEKYSITYYDITKNTTSYAVSKYINLITDNLEDKELYSFMPVFFGNGGIYATNGFVKIDKEKQNYGNSIPVKNINNDIDVLWVDIYNMKNVLKKYNISDADVKLDKKKKMFARFLNKQHMYWWYTELCKNEEAKYPEEIWTKWTEHLFVRKKRLHIVNDKLDIVDVFTPISKIDNIDDGLKTSFKEFYEQIQYSPSTDLWGFGTDEKKYDMEIVFDITAIRLDSDIYNKIIKLKEKDSKLYKDLYIYRLESENDWEIKYGNTNISKVEYDSTIDDDWTEVAHTLIPIFNEIYVENKENTKIYAANKLRDIRKTDITDINGDVLDTFYRYDSNDIPLMIQLTDAEYNVLSKLSNYTDTINTVDEEDSTKHIKTIFEVYTNKRLENCLYHKFVSSSISLNTIKDDLKYNYPGFSTYKAPDGTNYGYWVMNLKIDNTINSLDMLGVYNGNITNNIKTFKYINGHNIINNPNYFFNVLLQLLPFSKVQPFDLFRYLTTVVSPTNIHFKCRFKQSRLTNDDINTNPQELATSVSDMQTNLNFQRYFGWIVPIFNRVISVKDQWLLKLKNADTKMLETGEYPSIGDFAMYKTTLGINNFTPLQVYTVSQNDKNYDNESDVFTPVEYKQFNASNVINAEKSYKYTDPYLRQYNYIKEITDITNTNYQDNLYKVFCNLIEGTQFAKYNTSETEYKRKYLFNLYDAKIVSEPVRLTFDKDSKLYRVTYIYELK